MLATRWNIWISIQIFLFHWHLISELQNYLGCKRLGKSSSFNPCATGRDSLHIRERQVLQQLGSDTQCDPELFLSRCPQLVTHRYAGSRGCSPAPVAGTDHHTAHYSNVFLACHTWWRGWCIKLEKLRSLGMGSRSVRVSTVFSTPCYVIQPCGKYLWEILLVNHYKRLKMTTILRKGKPMPHREVALMANLLED